MSDLSSATMSWLAAHHGVITTAVLRSHGVGRCTIDRLVAAGVLIRVAKSVFVVASAPRTIEQRCAVLSAAHPGGFVTGPTAGVLAGLRRMPRVSELHFAVHHGVHLDTSRGVRWRQTTVIRDVDRSAREDGISIASWPRLAFDLAADLRQLDHISVVNQLLHARRLAVDDLLAIDRRLGHPGRAGSGTFRRTLATLTGSAPNQSHPEVALADALRRRQVPVQQQAMVVQPSDGVEIHIDLAVPELRWGIELDIHPEHRSLEGHAVDARRRRELHHVDWQIEVVTEADMDDVDRVADELAALFRARMRRHPSAS